MRLWAGIAGASIAASVSAGLSPAQAADYAMACVKGDDERTIAIVSPGTVGRACDVRYARDGGADVSVPYHADNSQAFCEDKANELVATLSDTGYACAAVTVQTAAQPAPPAAAAPAPQTAAAPASGVVIRPTTLSSLPVAGTTASVVTPVTESVTESVAEPVAAPAMPEPVVNDAGASGVVAAAPIPAPQPTPETSVLEEKMNQILASAEPEDDGPIAVRGPAQLTTEMVEPIATPAAAPVGRIVGAEPDARPVQPVAPVTQAALQAPPAPAPEVAPEVEPEPAPPASEPAAETAAPQTPAPGPSKKEDVKTAPPAPEPASAPKRQAELSTKPRSPAAVVAATLRAQAAAWNEGDLDAFMEAYWKSDDLAFVSDGKVTRGWSATMKRYRDRYAKDSGLGRLSLENMNVMVVTDDVAVATGRFALAHGEAGGSGHFSLTLRRMNGVWRIVHDHTISDPKAAQ
ncbi:MAG: YybH family protein [Hyphococcus sp.]